MQPYIFPYIGYFQLIHAVDTFVFYDDVQFIKKGFINRNSILVNGTSFQFTIPCKSISQNKLIKDTELAFTEKAKVTFLKTIQHAYQKAPFFDKVFPLIESFIVNDTSQSISELAIDSVKCITNYLNIQKQWRISSQNHDDSKLLKKEIRLIQIAKHEKALTYINSIGGFDLYDKEDFEEHDIHINFIKPKQIIYKQFNNIFVPGLSIIDVIMFNSIEDIESLINQFELV
ncbi:WbqC family protein [Yeosuana sp. MJ-SS3]|uniref:WbqC family protein n=1 Tax=Gilvirhabdus luticola TaxID=3079858 RepID=A0ABU3U501_9FLAO|nr:WbqC family protein [Yeosuana sp. MJ-SS3]MDU8885484.1 WbqC family protein [Yeosuana sp. MJ-SS3]